MNHFCVVKSFNIFKNKSVRPTIILDSEPVDPLSLEERMEVFYAGIIPRKRFL
jgi:hypothetical protein